MWGHTQGDYADSGNAAIVELTEGDTVYVQSRDQYDVSLFGAPDEIYTTMTATYLGETYEGKISWRVYGYRSIIFSVTYSF